MVARLRSHSGRIFEEHDLRFGAGSQIDAHHIESHLRGFRRRQLPCVSSRQLAKDASLVPVHRSFGRGRAARPARLHFHDAQQRSLSGDQVHVAGHVSARPAPRHYRVAFAQ